MSNNPASRQSWIFDLLKSEGSSYAETYSKYKVRYSKKELTFVKDWKKAKVDYSDYITRLNEAKDVQSIAIEVEALTNGLKSKIERQLEIQKQIVEIQDKLRFGKFLDFYIHLGNPKTWTRDLTAVEISRYNSLICTLQAELSKMDGSYTAIKNEMAIVNNMPVCLDDLTLEEKILYLKINLKQ